MSFTKAGIYNLALGALLLQRRTTDPATDQSNEVRVLNTYWQVAFDATLSDLDLDSTSLDAELELVEEDPNDDWLYAYSYPTDCILLRRIRSLAGAAQDTKRSHIPKLVRMFEGDKVIFTNEPEAIAEYVSNEVSIASLTAQTCMAIAFMLARLSAPLIVGKGAKTLLDAIKSDYLVAKAEALEIDQRENFNFATDQAQSEFVDERTS